MKTPTDLSGTRPAPRDLRWWRNVMLVAIPLHLLWTGLSFGLRPEHWIADGLLLALVLVPGWPREFSLGAAPFWFSAVLYENFRYVKHLRGPVHVADLFEAERRWFGVTVGQGAARERIIWPEYFRRNPLPVLDLLCGFAYLIYLFQTVGVAIYLFIRDKRRLPLLSFGFLLTNLLGMVGYLVYPAAPPWYVELYGLGPAIMTVAPNAAGAARFDELLGINYFSQFYSRSPVVFGAMPSLHVAYPVLVLCVTASKGRGWFWGSLGFALWVTFSAVYLRHHYIFDAVFGALVAVVAYLGVRGLSVVWSRYRAGQGVGGGQNGSPVPVTEADRAGLSS